MVLGYLGAAEDVAALEQLASGDDQMVAERASWAIKEIRQRVS